MMRSALLATLMLALPTHAFAEDIPPPITQAQVKAGIVKVNAAAVGFRACRASSTGAQLGRCYAAVYWQLRPAVWNLMFGLDTFCDTPNSFYLRGNTLYNLLGKTHRYPTRPNVDATTRAWNAFHASLRRSLLVSRRLSGRSTAWRAAAVQMVATSRSAAAVHGRCAMPHEQRRLRLFFDNLSFPHYVPLTHRLETRFRFSGAPSRPHSAGIPDWDGGD